MPAGEQGLCGGHRGKRPAALELFSKSGAGLLRRHPHGHPHAADGRPDRPPTTSGILAQREGASPIIAMTANAFDDDIDKSKASGMNAHLAKPIEPERLFQVLYDLIPWAGRRSDPWPT